MAVFGYVRVSTERQAAVGESLAVQARSIEGYAMMHGLTLQRTYVERGVSGSKPISERPEGASLLAGLKRGDVVITSKLDRMFRSALDALDVLGKLKDRGVSLHMIDLGGDVTGNGISRLVFTILSAVAEAERDRIRERIVDTKRDQHARGRYLGGSVPFGYSRADDGSLVMVDEQQEAIAKAVSLRRTGHSLRSITSALNADGFGISHVAVGRILRTENGKS